MWFTLALLAMTMLAARRSTEKKVAKGVDSLAMTWIQQAMALPFIIATLFFAKFYWPTDLSAHFWLLMSAYVFFGSIDLYCYFKAISLADISFVAPLLTLTAVGNVFGAYIVLHQVPTAVGFLGVLGIVGGAYVINRAKNKSAVRQRRNNKKALLYILLLVVVRSYYSNIEVSMLHESNPVTFNFYSSVLTVPFVLLVAMMIKRRNKKYWKQVGTSVRSNMLPLIFIGVTYTVNMLATYQAKLWSPNAGYIASIKSAQVLPVMLIGMFFFKEKIVAAQWYGVMLILGGLLLLALS